MEPNTEPYTPEEEQALRAMWLAGKGIREIAATLNRSWASVVRKKKIMKLPPRAVGPQPTLAPAEHAACREALTMAAEAEAARDVGEEGGRLYTDGSPLRQRCCWPMWGAEGRPSHVYCDDTIVAGGVYCPRHTMKSRADRRGVERSSGLGVKQLMRRLP